MQNLRLGCEPVVTEDSLHLGNYGTFHTKVDVTPFAALRVPAPFIGKANPADEAHLAVHDEKLAMRPMVKAEEFDRYQGI